MRQITLNNALKEKNVWFRVTPEQAILTAKLRNFTEFLSAKIITLFEYNCNYLSTEVQVQEFLKSYSFKYEQIQIIDEVPFKTQKEVWEFLVSNEGNVVEHTFDGTKLTLVNGELFNIGMQSKCRLSLIVPYEWKPSSELYKPKPKEWWELNGNKPTLCWYFDYKEDDDKSVGLCTHTSGEFKAQTSSFLWKYAVPLTAEELAMYSFKPLED